MRRAPPARGLRAAVAAAFLTACGTLPQATDSAAPLVWQRVRFNMVWDRAEPPRWHMDALIAHRVAAPQLERERPSVALWRFHRRAADDAAGHSFSLLTRAPAPTNAQLCRSLSDDPLIAAMRDAGLLVRVECEAYAAERERLVEATSDPRWSAPLQRAWPHYIMGVSEMWLRLIDEHARRLDAADAAADLPQLLALYRQADAAVSETWQREGHHTLLHHLNGLFGYAPLDPGRDGQRRF